VNDADVRAWARERIGGKLRYDLRNSIAWSVVLTTIFVAGKVSYDYLFRDSRHDWMDAIGGWAFQFVIVLTASALWLSLKWNRREAAYRLALEDDPSLGI
jgi:hypothetical protein